MAICEKWQKTTNRKMIISWGDDAFIDASEIGSHKLFDKLARHVVESFRSNQNFTGWHISESIFRQLWQSRPALLQAKQYSRCVVELMNEWKFQVFFPKTPSKRFPSHERGKWSQCRRWSTQKSASWDFDSGAPENQRFLFTTRMFFIFRTLHRRPLKFGALRRRGSRISSNLNDFFQGFKLSVDKLNK